MKKNIYLTTLTLNVMETNKEMPKQPLVFKDEQEKINYLQKLADYYGLEADFHKPQEEDKYYLIKYPKHAGEHYGYMESLQDALSDITAAAQSVVGAENRLPENLKEVIKKYKFKNYWDLPEEEVNFDYYEETEKYIEYLYQKAKEIEEWGEKNN
jgi:hypothetical protein